MPALVQIDTDILIDFGRGVQEAVNYLSSYANTATPAISTITQMELMVGCRNKQELLALEQFLKRFTILSLNATVSTQAVQLLQQYRLSHGLLIADALIAATAVVLSHPLITKNQRDFRFITELIFLPYP